MRTDITLPPRGFTRSEAFCPWRQAGPPAWAGRGGSGARQSTSSAIPSSSSRCEAGSGEGAASAPRFRSRFRSSSSWMRSGCCQPGSSSHGLSLPAGSHRPGAASGPEASIWQPAGSNESSDSAAAQEQAVSSSLPAASSASAARSARARRAPKKEVSSCRQRGSGCKRAGREFQATRVRRGVCGERWRQRVTARGRRDEGAGGACTSATEGLRASHPAQRLTRHAQRQRQRRSLRPELRSSALRSLCCPQRGVERCICRHQLRRRLLCDAPHAELLRHGALK